MPAAAPSSRRYRLQSGDLSAEVQPDVGGALASFSSRRDDGSEHHWLRPFNAAATTAPPALAMASFPLVPWCNRIRDGRFDWNERHVQLAPNVPGSAHTLHGIGWQRPWTVVAVDAHSIEMTLEDHGQGEWPFPFLARQRYALQNGILEIGLELCNTGREVMPAGIGHHPYFPHRRDGAGTRVTAHVDAIWLSDREAMPTTLSASDPTVAALAKGMCLADFALDNNFTGYRRHAVIDWPDGSSLRIEASEPLDFMVLFTPAADSIFVLEAVSNCTDWINLLARPAPGVTSATVGGTPLAPGGVLRMTTRFAPQMKSASRPTEP